MSGAQYAVVVCAVVMAGLVVGCWRPGVAVREYDPQAVQPVGKRVDDLYVRRAVDAALEIEGLRALAAERHELIVASVRVHALYDEDCLVERGEAVPERCEPMVEGLEEMRVLHERGAHGGEVRLQLAAPATPPVALPDACPPLPTDSSVESFLVHAFVYAAEDAASDLAYVFSVSGGGETIGCGPVRKPLDGPPADPELEEDSQLP